MPDSMTKVDRDDTAKLAYSLAKDLVKHEAKEMIASMFGVTEDEAEKLLVRGKDLARRAREKGKAA